MLPFQKKKKNVSIMEEHVRRVKENLSVPHFDISDGDDSNNNVWMRQPGWRDVGPDDVTLVAAAADRWQCRSRDVGPDDVTVVAAAADRWRPRSSRRRRGGA